MHVDDAYLVQRAQEGYLDAYSELVARHGTLVYRVALRMLGNHHDAQDLAQESLVVAWQQLPRFRGDSAFATWLYRIVTRRALSTLRGRRSAQSFDVFEDEVASTERDPAVLAERDLTVDAVSAAIAQLPPAQRLVIVLHHFEGLSYDEVARVIDSTEPSVRSHLFRARRTLGRALEEWR